jgi:hypothetical protein
VTVALGHNTGIKLGDTTLFKQTFKNIDDKLWKDAGCSSELEYVEQTLAMSLPSAFYTKL